MRLTMDVQCCTGGCDCLNVGVECRIEAPLGSVISYIEKQSVFCLCTVYLLINTVCWSIELALNPSDLWQFDRIRIQSPSHPGYHFNRDFLGSPGLARWCSSLIYHWFLIWTLTQHSLQLHQMCFDTILLSLLWLSSASSSFSPRLGLYLSTGYVNTAYLHYNVFKFIICHVSEELV